MSVRELLNVRPAASEQPRAASEWLPDLALDIVEPHGTPAPPAVRTWFRHIP